MISRNENMKLGRILVEMRLLDPDELERALVEHHKSGERLGSLLVKMALVTEEQLLRAIARQIGARFVRINEMDIAPDVIARMPARLATHFQVLPVGAGDGVLEVALSDPHNIHVLDDLRLNLKIEIEPVVALPKDIADGIKKYYGIGADTMQEMVDDSQEQAVSLDLSKVEDIETMAADASIVRFVNQIIKEAVADNATDIHVEPMEDDLRIRYRIDGVLYESPVPPNIKRFQSAIISRIKIMSDMDIAERRLPQDGKIKIKIGPRDFDLRVSTVPTPTGESVSVRILTRDEAFINLERLGFDEHHLGLFRSMIQRPHGIILVSGPTGSGKSTTLYAALREINTTERKLITVEDPIEYRMRGVTQIQITPSIGLTFARCLRSILRQDPDILLVGEIRDGETAQIAIQEALTGHLVFSTIHTNDACGVVTRLIDMDIEPFLISSSLEGLIAQRLVRLLCAECKVQFDPPAELLRRVNVTNELAAALKIFRHRGCELCRYTGYRGRTAVYEMARISETFRRMVVDRATAGDLKQEAMRRGMKPIRHDGWNKIKRGITSIEEVLNVTMDDETAMLGQGE
ncbi:Flp pilus assembly complex ATPase component TadA [Candidatus Sumerlaeota bacterium]|nr:Flp pilus assembly complex ATPase component TadA [Candidatus Sumerlaeota bacterium]